MFGKHHFVSLLSSFSADILSTFLSLDVGVKGLLLHSRSNAMIGEVVGPGAIYIHTHTYIHRLGLFSTLIMEVSFCTGQHPSVQRCITG